jgi:hypothetical protein
MTAQFRLGQSVRLRGRAIYGVAAGPAVVVRVMPNEGAEQQYRVRSEHETHERVVKESELLEG